MDRRNSKKIEKIHENCLKKPTRRRVTHGDVLDPHFTVAAT